MEKHSEFIISRASVVMCYTEIWQKQYLLGRFIGTMFW